MGSQGSRWAPGGTGRAGRGEVASGGRRRGPTRSRLDSACAIEPARPDRQACDRGVQVLWPVEALAPPLPPLGLRLSSPPSRRLRPRARPPPSETQAPLPTDGMAILPARLAVRLRLTAARLTRRARRLLVLLVLVGLALVLFVRTGNDRSPTTPLGWSPPPPHKCRAWLQTSCRAPSSMMRTATISGTSPKRPSSPRARSSDARREQLSLLRARNVVASPSRQRPSPLPGAAS